MDIQITIGDVDLSTVIGEDRVYGDPEEEYQPTPVTIADAIVKELTERLAKSDAYDSLRRAVSTARTEVIHAHLEPIVAEAIEQGVQKTNAYGDPIGQATTLRALIVSEVKEYLTKSTGNYQSGRTVIRDFVTKEVDLALKNELAAVIADEKAKVVAAVRASAATLIADAVKQGIGR